jgi:hypothetical protein
LTLGVRRGPTELTHQTTRSASNCGLAIYIKKYLKAKRKNYENSNISPCKKYNLQKSPLKETKNPSRYYYNSIITNLKFQHKPKISSFKNPHNKNRPIIIIT